MISLDKTFEIKKSEKNIDYEEAVQLMKKRVEDIINKKEKVKE